MSAVKTNCEDE